MKKFTLILLILLTLVLIVGCDFQFSMRNKALPDVKKTFHVEVGDTEKLKQEADEFKQETKEVVETVVAEVTNQCKDVECFEPKFKECEKDIDFISSEIEGVLVYKYTIIGEKDGRCEVKSVFEKNPNPDWVGKEMLCRLDTSLDFETAITTFEDCEGELYDLLNQ